MNSVDFSGVIEIKPLETGAAFLPVTQLYILSRLNAKSCISRSDLGRVCHYPLCTELHVSKCKTAWYSRDLLFS